MKYEKKMIKWVGGKKNIFSKLSIQTCSGCNLAYWGRIMLKMSGKPGYCRDCWHKKTNRWIHTDIRLLDQSEKDMIQEYFKISGVRISYINPEEL